MALKKLLVFTLLAVATPFCCRAQKQANVWHFGDSLCLDFSSGSPVTVAGGHLFSFEGCASYCDAYGSLQLYTNGGGREFAFSLQDEGHIWNRLGASMYDMLGVKGGGFSSAQSAVVFEAPGEDSTYYIFTMDEIEHTVGASPATNAAQPVGRGLRYFKVDMRLSGGLGAVTLADQPVEEPSFEGLCAIRHSNEEDYWVLIHQDSSAAGASSTTNIGIYAVTSGGVAFHGSFPFAGNGVIKGSPDGKWVATTNSVMQFDNTSGVLSGALTLSPADEGVEFSPNSRYLYAISSGVSSADSIVRYDLSAGSIPASRSLVGTFTVSGYLAQMQLGPDGMIYFVDYDFGAEAGATHRIHCPNTLSPTIETTVFNIGSLGLPNFAAWLFENYDSTFVSLGPDTVNLALLGGSYLLNAANPGATHLWSTGDTTQTLLVTIPGTYSVLVEGPCGAGTDTIVVIDSIPTGLDDAPSPQWASLFPNPTRGNVHLKLNLTTEEMVTVQFHSAEGRRMAAPCAEKLPMGTHQLSWDLHELPPGVYQVTVRCSSGKSYSERVVIMR